MFTVVVFDLRHISLHTTAQTVQRHLIFMGVCCEQVVVIVLIHLSGRIGRWLLCKKKWSANSRSRIYHYHEKEVIRNTAFVSKCCHWRHSSIFALNANKMWDISPLISNRHPSFTSKCNRIWTFPQFLWWGFFTQLTAPLLFSCRYL